MCAQSSLPSPSCIHVLLRQDRAWISQTGEGLWGWDSSLGFDHSSERGKKITLNSIFCGVGKEALGWEREGKSFRN